MADEVDIERLVEQAKRQGYFATEDRAELSLDLRQFNELMSALKRHNIPFGSPAAKLARELTEETISQRTARKVINALRKGTPPPEGVLLFSTGRESLMNRFRRHLQSVEEGRSQVRFMNADVGQGKTHALYLLREMAFRQDFVVSRVSLEQDSCPLHDFMRVYHRVMWKIETKDDRHESALETVLDRWIERMGQHPRETVERIVDTLPEDLIQALIADHSATNPIKPSEEKRLLMLRYLSGEKVRLSDLRRHDVQERVEEGNALEMLGHMARLFRHLGYSGVCILFDEAESIHSFADSRHRDAAYSNLSGLARDSRKFSHCYFLYATTPSFFQSYSRYWPRDQAIGPEEVLELDSLDEGELRELAHRICRIYEVAYSTTIPEDAKSFVERLAPKMTTEPIGRVVRSCVAYLDEKR
jgi:hypothetical protein